MTRDYSFFDAELPAQATDCERELARRYTKLRQVAVDGEPLAVTVWLIVDNQQFRLDGYAETPAVGGWKCWMLAKAIKQILADKGV